MASIKLPGPSTVRLAAFLDSNLPLESVPFSAAIAACSRGQWEVAIAALTSSRVLGNHWGFFSLQPTILYGTLRQVLDETTTLPEI